MKQRALSDPFGEIDGSAARHLHGDIDSENPAALVGADPPGEADGMALAGHHHIVAAPEPTFRRPAGDMGSQGGEGCPLRRLGLLAAEAAAGAPAFADDLRLGNAERAGNDPADMA